MQLHIGCSGWFYKDWREIFYPKGLPMGDWLSFYANTFNTVEVNSTFYHFPLVSAVKGWYSKVPPSFRYVIKASRFITHVQRFKGVKEPLNLLYGLKQILGEKLEGFLFQLPPSLHYSPETLENILESLDRRYQNVVEFRHSSWWRADVLERLQEQGIIFCSVKGLGLPDDIILIGGKFYLRFHGESSWDRYHYNYTEFELDNVAQKIVKDRKNLKKGWVYFNNDFEGHAIANALNFQKILKWRLCSQKRLEN